MHKVQTVHSLASGAVAYNRRATMRRIVAAVFAAFIAWTTVPACAQSDSGEITIAVTDAQTKQAVGLARVLLDGAVITSELTGTNGKVTFTDVPDGIYRCRVI